MRTKSFLSVMLVFLVVAGTRCLQAQARDAERDMAPETTSRVSKDYVAPFGVPLAPPIYLINFLLLYVSNPENAAFMPAYRVALPQEVYKCLVDNPDGCPYAEMARFFAEQAADTGDGRNQKTFWPESCRTSPQLENLAPPEDRRADQINKPLGRKRADQLAQLLGIKPDMILTNEEYQCLIGAPPRDATKKSSTLALSTSPIRREIRTFRFRAGDCIRLRMETCEAIARRRRPVLSSTVCSRGRWRRLPNSADSRTS